MRWIHAARTRLKLLVSPRAAETRMSEEMAFHIEMETARLRARAWRPGRRGASAGRVRGVSSTRRICATAAASPVSAVSADLKLAAGC